MDSFQNNRQTSIDAIRRAEQAESASRAKSEFLAVLSHELRVSLTGIIGMAQLLNIDCLLPSQHAQVEDILKASEHILSLVDELLDIAKLEAGKVQLESTVFNFAKLIEETLGVLRFQAEAKGLQLLYQYDPQAPQNVIGDPRVLRQIILNFVGNALKFTPQGTIIVKVNCHSLTDVQANLLLIIEDTGVGIIPEQLQILLASLNQECESNPRHYGSGGLGLVITNNYLKLMGATLQIQSQPQNGSKFICNIPFALPNKNIIEQAQPAPIKLAPVSMAKVLKIMLVEDNLMIQKVYKKMLEKIGCQVDIANNATEALKLHANGYDLIFMDIGLPEVSGLEITQEIRRREGQTKHTPIIAMTGYGHDQDKQNCLRAGIDEVAVKPVRLETVKQLVQKWTQASS